MGFRTIQHKTKCAVDETLPWAWMKGDDFALYQLRKADLSGLVEIRAMFNLYGKNLSFSHMPEFVLCLNIECIDQRIAMKNFAWHHYKSVSPKYVLLFGYFECGNCSEIKKIKVPLKNEGLPTTTQPPLT